jgi:hypothetical protein
MFRGQLREVAHAKFGLSIYLRSTASEEAARSSESNRQEAEIVYARGREVVLAAAPDLLN